MKQVKRIKEKYEKELLVKENVVGVAIGFKRTGGKKTNELAVVVDVSRKVAESDLAERDIVPEKLDGIRTDVVETGLIRALAYDPTKKFRPAPGGVSIGHRDITAGTLGISVPHQVSPPSESDESYCSVYGMAILWPLSQEVAEEVAEEEFYILSNNHVLANSNEAELGDPIYQPGPSDGGGPNDTIAQLSAFVPIKFGGGLNKVDCALAKPLNPADVIKREILEIGEVSGTVEVQLGMNVRKYGRTTQLTENEVIQIHATVDVGGYLGGKVARFEDQVITWLMAGGGDSGSLVVERDGQRAVGLLFAGSPSTTIFNRIVNVEEALGIKL